MSPFPRTKTALLWLCVTGCSHESALPPAQDAPVIETPAVTQQGRKDAAAADAPAAVDPGPDAATFPRENVVFPDDSGVINVKRPPYGAVGDGLVDDTAALQRALSAFASENRIIYLPNGTYRVTARLNWPAGPHQGLDHKRTILQGQSRDGTVIRLADSAPGFSDPAKPQAVVWTGQRPAQRFRNAIRNLTISVGPNNPGAVGLQFIANNQGGLRDVRIVSEDRKGRFGLDMGYTDEIGPLLARGVEVVGFDVGIRTFWQTASVTFEDVRLSDQNVWGWHNYGQTTFVRRLHSRNAVTAIYNEKDSPGSMMLVDAELIGVGAASGKPAIHNERTLFVRGLRTSGYANAILHQDKGRGNEPGITGPVVDEWTSHGAGRELFSTGAPVKSLALPVRETPVVTWDPLTAWKSPAAFGGKVGDDQDDSAALQAAIDAGGTTVYLPNGSWRITGEVQLRGPVQRLICTEGRIVGGGIIRVGDGTASTVVIERCELNGITISHEAPRTLVLSSLTGGRYRSQGAAPGDLFIEDVVFDPLLVRPGQRVWARQLNQETDVQNTADEAKVVNDGGRLWILGMKTEQAGTLLKTKNGGTTELLGAFFLANGAAKTEPGVVVQDASTSLAAVTVRVQGVNSVWTPAVEETQAGQTKQSPDHNLLFSTGVRSTEAP
jgi:large repetitive protein